MKDIRRGPIISNKTQCFCFLCMIYQILYPNQICYTIIETTKTSLHRVVSMRSISADDARISDKTVHYAESVTVFSSFYLDHCHCQIENGITHMYICICIRI